jgi:hypothetical protein
VSDESDNQPGGIRRYQFEPGKSGNPGGRPKGYERRLREVIEGETVEYKNRGVIPAWEAIVLQAIDDAINGSPVARQHGRNFIADRLMGKPKQDIRIEDATPVDDTKLVDATEEQLEALAMLGLADGKLH